MPGKTLSAISRWVLRWVLKPMWAILKVPITGMFKLAVVIFSIFLILALIMAWCFISYQIAWWVADETFTRVCLLIFLVFGVIVGIASKLGQHAWLDASQSAQAEYLADLLKKNGDKGDYSPVRNIVYRRMLEE